MGCGASKPTVINEPTYELGEPPVVIEPSKQPLKEFACKEIQVEDFKPLEFLAKEPARKKSDAGGSELLCKLRAQIEVGFSRRDTAYLKQVFMKHSDGFVICEAKLIEAFKELGVDIAVQDVGELFRTIDFNQDGGLGFEEFRRIIQDPWEPSPLESWARSLPLAQLLADSLPDKQSGDRLRDVSRLSDVEIKFAIMGFAEGLKKLLSEHLDLLRKSFSAIDKKIPENGIASKFQLLSGGRIEDFHAGLMKRTGQPLGNFQVAMKDEHCKNRDNQPRFKTPNYEITTSSSREWEIVVDRERPSTAESMHNRVIPNLEELLKLPICHKSKLRMEEIIAIVLYTGPMYLVYNSILRQHGDLYQSFVQANNLFPTTIFVLVSAIQKLSRAIKLPKGLLLYRGLGNNKDLPDCFFKSDDVGRKGYTEYGFMSTSLEKSIALHYSGVKESVSISSVLVISVGSVDRGACIRDFSQYQDEIEYLWLPCSFVQQSGPSYFEVTEHGPVRMIPCSINSNHKIMTTEEYIERTKVMHLSSFTNVVQELEVSLCELAEASGSEGRLLADSSRLLNAQGDSRSAPWTVAAFVKGIATDCQAVLEQHRVLEVGRYSDGDGYRKLVLEMVDVQMMARSKLEGWLRDSDVRIAVQHGVDLRTAHRRFIDFLQDRLPADGEGRKAAAEDLCKRKGLFHTSVDETNELGESRLMAACVEGQAVQDVRLLCYAGADVNRSAITGGPTPIFAAALGGHAECVRELGRQGAIAGAEVAGQTAIYVAASMGHLACLEELTKLGADLDKPDGEGITPTAAAVRNNHPKCVAALAASRADLNRPDGRGTAPVAMAIEAGHLECIEELVKGGADVNRPNKEGVTPLLAAVLSNSVRCVELLAQAPGADLRQADAQGRTLLYHAARRGTAELIRALKAAGAEIKRVDKLGRAPLHAAAEEGNVPGINELVALGAEVNRQDANGDTPAAMAAAVGHAESIVALATLKADLNKTNSLGKAPVHRAVEKDHFECLQALKEAGAEVTRLWHGKTPLEMAEARHFEHCAGVLHGTYDSSTANHILRMRHKA